MRFLASSTIDSDEQFAIDHPVPPPYGSLPKENREYFTGQRVQAGDPNTTTYILGDLPLPSGQLLVTDPCYEETLGERIWCNALIELLPHDAYQVRLVKESEQNENSVDFVSFGVFHPDYTSVIPNEIAHDDIGVDSASISFSDANHTLSLEHYLHGNHDHHPGVYDWQGGRIATTWCDDGGYPLLVGRNEHDEIVAAEVVGYFEYDDEEDDDEEDA